MGKIGSFNCFNNTFFYYNGYMDDVRFYHRELTPADVISLYNFPYPQNSMGTLNLGNDTSICGNINLTLNATTTNATSYQWSSGQTTPSITVTQPGTYWVTVTEDACVQYSDTITIDNMQANLLQDMAVCEGQTVTLDAGTGYSSYSWNPGATTQTITVNTVGTYSVQVNNGNCFISDTAVISYNTSPAPTAAFTYSIISSSGNNYTLSFTNNTTNGLSYSWDFGDGTTSNLAQPSHVFTCNTLYNIQLIAYNICEADTVTQSFYRNCLTNAVPDITEEISLQIFPIPADEILHLRYQLEKQSEVELKLFNSLGQVVLEKSYGREVGEVHKELGIAPLIEGIYTLRIITESGTAVYKLAVE